MGNLTLCLVVEEKKKQEKIASGAKRTCNIGTPIQITPTWKQWTSPVVGPHLNTCTKG